MFNHLEQTKTIPASLEEMMNLEGFGLKSATLILQTFHNKPFMVCVDRHLHRSFKKLGWVHPGSKTPEESSIQVSLWLLEDEFININNLVAGIAQLLQDKKKRHIVLRSAKQQCVEYLVNPLFATLTKKDKKVP